MKKAILFDLDGTLLYTLEDIANATNATLRSFGLPERTLEEIRRMVGNGARTQMQRAIGREEPRFEEIYRFYQAYYPLHCRETTRPYPGILELGNRLKELGYRLGIVSNKPDGATKALWRAFFPEFDYAQGATEGIAIKPAPDMAWAALRALDASPESSVYVGDSEVDLELAQAANMPCIAVTWGYRDEDLLRQRGAKHLCGSTSEFMEALKEAEQEHGQ